MASYDKIDLGRSYIERTGSRLESEFIGEVDKDQYDDLAYEFLHRDEIAKAKSAISDPNKRFEYQLKLKDSAKAEFKNNMDLWHQRYKVSERAAIKLVEQSQRSNPEKPTKFFTANLYNYMRKRFGPGISLKFFTSTGGTHLDAAYGIDCFFKIYNEESGQELAIATIDLTGRERKDSTKAKVLLNINKDDRDKYDPSGEDYDKKFFDAKVGEFSEIIIDALLEDNAKR